MGLGMDSAFVAAHFLKERRKAAELQMVVLLPAAKLWFALTGQVLVIWWDAESLLPAVPAAADRIPPDY